MFDPRSSLGTRLRIGVAYKGLHGSSDSTRRHWQFAAARLDFDGEEVHVAVLLQELADARHVLVGVAHHVQNRQQLPQAHWEILRHPAAAGQGAHSLASIVFSSLSML